MYSEILQFLCTYLSLSVYLSLSLSLYVRARARVCVCVCVLERSLMYACIKIGSLSTTFVCFLHSEVSSVLDVISLMEIKRLMIV